MKTAFVPFQIEIGTERFVRGDFYPARERANANVILCHGYKGFKDWGFFPYVAEQLAETYNVVKFNFSMNGIGENLQDFTELEKFARLTYSSELEDLHTVVQHVQNGTLPLHTEEKDKDSRAAEHGESALDPNLSLFLVGHSRGAGASLIYAFDHRESVAGVISWNGITNVDLFSEEQKREMRSEGCTFIHNARTQQNMPQSVEILKDMEANVERFDIVGRAKQSDVPIVLIQGTDDLPHLVERSKHLHAARPDVAWIRISGGNHTFNAVHPFKGTTEQLEEAIKQTKNFIDHFDRQSAG